MLLQDILSIIEGLYLLHMFMFVVIASPILIEIDSEVDREGLASMEKPFILAFILWPLHLSSYDFYFMQKYLASDSCKTW